MEIKWYTFTVHFLEDPSVKLIWVIMLIK